MICSEYDGKMYWIFPLKEKMRQQNRKILFLSIFLLMLISSGVSGQDFQTASEFFDAVSLNYGKVEDYQARIEVLQDDSEMAGIIYYKTPNLLRINFTEPEDQVLVVDGIQLILYLPLHHVLMRQEVTRHSESSLATMVSEQGLRLLKQNYSVAFLEGPEAVPLDQGSDEMVRKLKLAWRTPGQGFRQIEISVNKDMLIRRMVGIADNFNTVQFDFINIKLNQGLPDARFVFENPPSAYTIKNFLFEPES